MNYNSTKIGHTDIKLVENRNLVLLFGLILSSVERKLLK